MTIWLFIASLASAVISSMGLGGGGILILYLTAFVGMEQLKAQGINLVFFMPTAVIAIILHAKNHLIEWKRVTFIALGGIAGVLAGTWASQYIPSELLSKIFAVSLLVLGVKELFKRRDN